MNIYIHIEVKAREFESRMLLALAAAERGHSVVLGSREETVDLAAAGLLTPGIVHDKCVTPYSKKLGRMEAMRARGHLITSQDEEHGLLYDSYDDFARMRYSATSIGMADRVFLWGQFDHEVIARTYPDHADRFVACGSPRVDLWRQDVRPVLSPALKAACDAGPLVLVPSNFVLALNAGRIWDFIKLQNDLYRKQRADAAGVLAGSAQFGETSLFRRTALQFELIRHFVRMIRSLSRSFPQASIVVRPHPAEDARAWPALLGRGLANVTVSADGALINWIKKARVVVHNSCTSGLEAAVAGVPRIAYRPVRSKYEASVPNSVSYPAGSLPDLTAAVGRLLSGQALELPAENRAAADRVLASRFANLEGSLAADRIVREWEALDRPDLRRPNDWRAVHAALARDDRALPPPDSAAPARVDLPSHKFPDLTEAEISAFATHLRDSMDRFHTVRWKRLGQRSFGFFKS